MFTGHFKHAWYVRGGPDEPASGSRGLKLDLTIHYNYTLLPETTLQMNTSG